MYFNLGVSVAERICCVGPARLVAGCGLGFPAETIWPAHICCMSLTSTGATAHPTPVGWPSGVDAGHGRTGESKLPVVECCLVTVEGASPKVVQIVHHIILHASEV